MKQPRLYVRSGETYQAARRRWLPKWFHYRDATIMAECMHQASVCSSYRLRQRFRAFYGVEVKWL
jgi:hypothetical protein